MINANFGQYWSRIYSLRGPELKKKIFLWGAHPQEIAMFYHETVLRCTLTITHACAHQVQGVYAHTSDPGCMPVYSVGYL